MAKKVATTIYITPEQHALLKVLHERSRVPVAEFIRQGIDLVLEKNSDLLPGQLEFQPLPLSVVDSDKPLVTSKSF